MTKSRHFQGGRSYHVTQRCHGRDFLLGKDVDLLLRKLACDPDREKFRQWYRATLDAMSECRTELRREPWWSGTKVIGDRQFVTRQVDQRHAEHIVELDDGTCTCTFT